MIHLSPRTQKTVKPLSRNGECRRNYSIRVWTKMDKFGLLDGAVLRGEALATLIFDREKWIKVCTSIRNGAKCSKWKSQAAGE